MQAIEQEFRRIRQREQDALAERTAIAYEKAPALRELTARKSAVFLDAAHRKIFPQEASAELTRIAGQEKSLLHSIGMPEDALLLHYQCKACQDTGYLGDGLRRPCSCRLMLAAKLDPRVRINARETFDAFRTDLFPDEEQAAKAITARDRLRAYALSLPHPDPLNYLIMGAPGLGKSYLGNAVAYQALSMGIPAVRTTAYDLLEDILKDLHGEPVNRRSFQTAPLLVLDDLGTEAVIPNVSENALFSIIDGRIARRLPTVYITNLTLRDLVDRYGMRIVSRLTDASTGSINLTGQNLRRRY